MMFWGIMLCIISFCLAGGLTLAETLTALGVGGLIGLGIAALALLFLFAALVAVVSEGK